MKLQTKLLLTFGLMLITSFILVEFYGYQQTQQEILSGVRQEAKVVRSILMATRRVYHHQFLNSGIPLNDKTLGFLPAHALSLISKDFLNWSQTEMTFNNVSDRSRNADNQADEIELDAMAYFRAHPAATERMITYKNKNKQVFYHFSSPIWVEQYCLKCHGSRESSPETIRTTYNTAYDYKVGELRGLMSIKLPSSLVTAGIINTRLKVATSHLLTFVASFIFGAWLLRILVIRKLSSIKAATTRIGAGDFTARVPVLGKDELSDVAVALNEMAEQRLQAEATRLELESQLLQKQKMEAIGYMAGGIAHNFNNDLFVVLGNVELSQFKTKDPKIQDLLKDAKKAILHSRDLINQIMTYSRQGVQHKVRVHLSKIVDETMAILRLTLAPTINLQMNFSSKSHSAFIDADVLNIKAILVNLCNNAARAMKQKGDLIISLDLVDLSAEEIPAQYEADPGVYAKLSFKDTGCGMDTKMVDKIFDPFFTTKEEYEGAGMGLATVQGIVAQHGGVIKVNSIPGEGTVFDLYFPVVDHADMESDQPSSKMTRGTEKILYIDDDEMLVSLIEKLLSEKGYQVVTVDEGQEALKLFTAKPDFFDLVITGQTMPDLSGEDLIRELKKAHPDLRTILCTEYSGQVDEIQAKQQGIDACCVKPLNLPEFLQTIRQVLDGVRS